MAEPRKKTRAKTSQAKTKAKDPFPKRIFAIASPHSVGGVSMFEADSFINSQTVGNFDSDPALVETAVDMLVDAGFDVLSANTAMINFCGARTTFERAFATNLIAEEREVLKPGGVQGTATFFDSVDTDLSGFIDPAGTDFGRVLEGVAIEEPYYPMANAMPPNVDSRCGRESSFNRFCCRSRPYGTGQRLLHFLRPPQVDTCYRTWICRINLCTLSRQCQSVLRCEE